MSVSYAVSDSATMLRRDLKHVARNPFMMFGSIGMPIFMLLLFVYVFGGALTGATGGASGGAEYIDYLAPGMILMTASFGSGSTAVTVCIDMTEGIISRFRTMAIARASVLTGHVIGSVLRTLFSIILVIGVALLMGFRPHASVGEWAAAIGVLALFTIALTWLTVAFGLVTKSAEAANSATLPLQFLPFISSAFVPTDSMPGVVQWFAENQPFTPVIETVRGLMMGTPIGNNGLLAVLWCVGLTLLGYFWAKSAFNREPNR